MISVCMTSYNGEKYIAKQISSILSQLTLEDELIISDDGSIDNTLAIINSYQDSRIKLLHHKSNKDLLTQHLGNYMLVAKNFENAIAHAKGDVIFLSDQDDIWQENRVKIALQELNQRILVMFNYKIIDENSFISSSIGYTKSPIYSNWGFNVIRSRFMCCCLVFKKELLSYILPFPEDLQSCDQWVGCNASKYGKIKFIKDSYHLYRRHGNNVSETTEKSKNSFLQKIEFRFKLYKQLKKNFKK